MKYIIKQLKRLFGFGTFHNFYSSIKEKVALPKSPITTINHQNTSPEIERKTKHLANKFNWKITLDRVAQTKEIKYWADELKGIDYWSTKEFYDIVLELFVDYEEKPKNWDIPEELKLRIINTSISIKKRRRDKYLDALTGLGRELTIYIAEADHLTEKEKYIFLSQLIIVLEKFEFQLGKLGKELFENYDLEFLQKLKDSFNPNNKYSEKFKHITDNISNDLKLIKEILIGGKNKRVDKKKNEISFESLFKKPKIIPSLIAYLKTKGGGKYISKDGHWIKSKAELMGFADTLKSESYLHNQYSISSVGRIFSEYFNLSISEKSWTEFNNYKRKDASSEFIYYLNDFELFYTLNS